MFSQQRWAEALVNTMGTQADEALQILKILVSWINKLSGSTGPGSAGSGDTMFYNVMSGNAIFGEIPARRTEAILKTAGSLTGMAGKVPYEGASSLAVLMIRKNCFRHSHRIMDAIQNLLDRNNKTVNAVLESVNPPDGIEVFLIEAVKKRTGAEKINLEHKIRPELIGGYRLRIGDDVIDASILSQLKQMETAMKAGLNRGYFNG